MYDPMDDALLLDFESYKGRLEEFLLMDDIDDFKDLNVLVPGSALGSECLAALALGAKHVTGLEVTANLVETSQKITNTVLRKNLKFKEFDGRTFPDHGFDLVLSGHVIEHTFDWKEHLNQCIIATRPTGRIYLEFPTRFHTRELHTGLISFEWLPYFLRRIMNLGSAHVLRSLKMTDKSNARLSIQNSLQQVSIWQIKKYLASFHNNRIVIKKSSKPSPGIVRLIIS